MPENGSFHDNQALPSWATEAKAQSAKAVAKSRALLNEPLPDMFLGRQHRAMIALPESEE